MRAAGSLSWYLVAEWPAERYFHPKNPPEQAYPETCTRDARDPLCEDGRVGLKRYHVDTNSGRLWRRASGSVQAS